jgi:hypothetical protein
VHIAITGPGLDATRFADATRADLCEANVSRQALYCTAVDGSSDLLICRSLGGSIVISITTVAFATVSFTVTETAH